MAATFEHTTKIRVQGVDAEWTVGPDSVVHVDGEKFIKLGAHTCARMRAIVFKDNLLAPRKLPKYFAFTTCSHGLLAMKRSRNDQHAADLSEDATKSRGAQRNLFRVDDVGPVAKKHRISRTAQKSLRDSPKIVEIIVSGRGGNNPPVIRVLRPVAAGDDLVMEFTTSACAALVAEMRGCGFQDPVQRDPDQPSGIWRRADRYVCPHNDRYYSLTNLESASGFVGDPTGYLAAHADEGDAGGSVESSDIVSSSDAVGCDNDASLQLAPPHPAMECTEPSAGSKAPPNRPRFSFDSWHKR